MAKKQGIIIWPLTVKTISLFYSIIFMENVCFMYSLDLEFIFDFDRKGIVETSTCPKDVLVLVL